jgi:hypothetical protein
VRNEGVNCLFARADQRGELTCLPEIVGQHDRLTVEQYALGRNVRSAAMNACACSRRTEAIGRRSIPGLPKPQLKNRQKHFVIDGEAIVLGVDGISDFNVLHSRKHDYEVQFCAFDILEGGDDLRKLPLKPSAAVSASPFQKECPPGVNHRTVTQLACA